eukprot:Rhum_TRINITY_DN5629_c0_g1::Rhum_TRINITY_DN5629_c0_g1_i1::g.17923::m.17923
MDCFDGVLSRVNDWDLTVVGMMHGTETVKTVYNPAVTNVTAILDRWLDAPNTATTAWTTTPEQQAEAEAWMTKKGTAHNLKTAPFDPKYWVLGQNHSQWYEKRHGQTCM